MVQQEIVDGSSIEQIRSVILNKVYVLLCFIFPPVLLISLTRVEDVGWQPYLYIMCLVTPLIWVVTFWRNAISFQIRALLFIVSVFLLGASAYWSNGVLGGGIWGFVITNVMATRLLGARWGWISLAAITFSMSITTFAILNDLVNYSSDIPTFAVNPSILFSALIVVLSMLSALTASLGTFHNFLLRSIEQSNARAAALVSEIHDREKAEAAQKKSETKFHRILENIQDVYFETSMDGTIQYCSPSCLTLSGYHQDELIGKNSTILYHNVADRQLLLESLEKDGKVRGLELIFEKKEGDIYNVEFNADIIFDSQGIPEGLHGTIRDVTLAKQSKERAQSAEKMEAIGLLAGGVAHDLNNIITAIVGYPDLILKTMPEDTELRAPLLAIKESGLRAAEVIADLLTVSKEAATSRELHDLHSLIKQYTSSPEYSAISGRFPQVEFQTSYEAEESVIDCSSVHIKKCLMNLVNNAAEAIIGKGKVILATSVCEINDAFVKTYAIEPGKYIVLSVEDNGPGIAKEDQKRIFEPFYTKKYLGRSGTGLGLAIVWNTVQHHQGVITLESSPKGSKFNLYFPLRSGIVVMEQSSSRQPQKSLGQGETVLVIDDEAGVRDIANQMLTIDGYRVEEASSGEEAIAYLKVHKADVLVIDMLMEPGINGRETFEEVLKISPNQKALVSSGFSENEEVEAILKLGAGGFVRKPYTKDQLCLAVRQVLNT